MPGANITSEVMRRTGSLRRFGVELEVCYAHNTLNLHTPFGQKDDGSVDGDGIEFYSPILQGDDGLEAVENLCAFAEANNWEVNESCGYHLHIDAGDLDASQRKRVFLAYKLTENLWRSFVKENREECGWCRAIPHTVEYIKDHGWSDLIRYAWNYVGRYAWCNIAAYESHRTIEIRAHHGTINKVAVTGWIKAHLRFVDFVKDKPMARLQTIFEGKSKEAQFRILEEIWGSEHLSRLYRRRARGLREAVEA